MEQRSVPAAELQQYLLDGRHLVIALVDKFRLERGLALWQEPGFSDEDEKGYKGELKPWGRLKDTMATNPIPKPYYVGAVLGMVGDALGVCFRLLLQFEVCIERH